MLRRAGEATPILATALLLSAQSPAAAAQPLHPTPPILPAPQAKTLNPPPPLTTTTASRPTWHAPLLPEAVGGWRWPMSPTPGVVRGFQPPAKPWAPGHRGVDLVGRPGSAVLSAGPGRVSYAGRLAGRGVVTVTHGELRTTYLPVRATVRVGRRVRAGERIGLLERLPRHCAWLPSQQTCLHWGLLRGDTYLDPLSVVRDRRVRLLPVWGRPTPTGMPGTPAGIPGTPAGSSPEPFPRDAAHPELVNSALVGSGTAGVTFLALLLLSRLRRQGFRNPFRGRRGGPSAARNVIDFTTARDRRGRRRPGPHQGPGQGPA